MKRWAQGTHQGLGTEEEVPVKEIGAAPLGWRRLRWLRRGGSAARAGKGGGVVQGEEEALGVPFIGRSGEGKGRQSGGMRTPAGIH
jgi:hypothetical protein